MRVWLVGGGTAGHVSPLLSLAAELKKQIGNESELGLAIITDRLYASRLVESGIGYPIRPVFSGKFRRYRGRSLINRLFDVKTGLLNLRDLFFVVIGTVQATSLALRQKPDVIFINGGSIGVPIAWAARITQTPYIVHESDTVMGLANKMIATYAARIATAFDINLGPKLAPKTIRTGIPISPQFLETPDEDNLRNLARGLNLASGLPVVLAVGGSLGAERLNNWLVSQADELLDKCQLVLVTGQRNYESVRNMVLRLEPALVTRLHLLAYTDRMADLMRLSDVVITRAGATTLMELAAIGRPALVVPNDMLSGGHQSANAEWFASSGMAESISEANIATNPAILTNAVHSLLADEPRRRRLAQAISKAHVPDSSSTLAGLILELAGEQN